ncbi:MAG: hypothetical protein RIA09_15990 [Hoeflea sp.]|jgi:hypothetical protein|uniref:hypothetical protein n=1 Tax=Hoeflea sp. TaxID=1940281 RepID=UPI0032ED5162
MKIPKGTENSRFAEDLRRLQRAIAEITPTTSELSEAVIRLNKALSNAEASKQ